MIISIPFLLATFAVYAFFKELHERTVGKNLMAYVMCLAFGYSIFSALQLRDENAIIPDDFCRFIAFSIYVSFLSGFLWLATISFEIWWTFG